MRKALSVLAGVVVLAFVYFVWPTPYRYFDHADGLYRVNRFTGYPMRLTTTGWASLEGQTSLYSQWKATQKSTP